MTGMESSNQQNRHVVRKFTLREESEIALPVGDGPADRLNMMWQLAQDCWAFVPGHDVKREFQRHVARLERRGR